MKNITKRFISLLVIIFLVILMLPDSGVFAGNEKAGGNYNYGEALQKAIMFYDYQVSGKMPDFIRTNWKGDSCINDGQDIGVDLSGGWFDAGDHVKFNLPMAYTTTMLGWSYINSKAAYVKSGEYQNILNQIKWVNDYLIKCNPDSNTYYFQIGKGGDDHAVWMPAEVLQMKRPVLKATSETGCASVICEAAASLSVASIIYKDIDSAYSQTCLQHAKQLYALAEKNPNDDYYNSTDASGFYKSWAGAYDDLSFAGCWLYLATQNKDYLSKAEQYATQFGTEPQTSTVAYKWTQCWDDTHYGALYLLAQITGKSMYKENLERNFDFWTTGVNGNTADRIDYTPKGLPWLSEWGPLRYATTEGFMAYMYATSGMCTPAKTDTYKKFAKSMADYALGSSGRSYVCGYGENSPQNPHHRSAHAGWENNCEGMPKTNRHVLYGALVGGPGKNDDYVDDRSNYYTNEVACDYNAGFTGLMAMLYNDFGGNPIKNWDPKEPVGQELFTKVGINAQNLNGEYSFIELKTEIYNTTAWPARRTDKLALRMFFDLSDVYQKGYTCNDMKIKTNYNQLSGTVTPMKAWDEAKHIYYADLDLSGKSIFPGGQQFYKCETQIRFEAPCKWDYTKSFSYKGLSGTGGNNVVDGKYIALYDNGKLIYGNEPDNGQTPTPVPDPTVKITSPVPSTVFKNTDRIVIKADATAPRDEITKVEFFNGNKLISADTTAPYSCSFTPDKTSDEEFKEYSLKAVVTTKSGKTSTSDIVNIKVKYKNEQDIPTPVISITSPADNTVFPDKTDNIEISADASITKGKIAKVDFYSNGNLIGTSQTSPYKCNFKPDTTSNTEYKSYSLTAVATSDKGKITTSKEINIKKKFKQAPSPSPTIKITSPADNTVYSSDTTKININAKASISKGYIDCVKFYADGKLIATDTSYPYNCSYSVSSSTADKTITINAVAVSDKGLETTSNDISVTILKQDAPPPPPPPVTHSDISLNVKSSDNAITNTLANDFILKNNGKESIDISKLKICYYYTKDGNEKQNFFVDNTGINYRSSPWYMAATSFTEGKFVDITQTSNADCCFEITFNSSGIMLDKDAEMTCATRVAKENWQNYNRANDYSFISSENVCVYYDGNLIYGNPLK